MNRTILIGIVALVLIGTIGTVLTGCAVKKPSEPPFGGVVELDFGLRGDDAVGLDIDEEKAEIRTFEYSYNGTIGGDFHTYIVENKLQEEGKVRFAYGSEIRGFSEDPVFMELEGEEAAALYDGLKALFVEYHVKEWNGFHKYNPNVLDGDGFSLHIKLADDNRVEVSGSNASPDGFWEFEKAMENYFAPYKEMVLEKVRQEKIAQGMVGKCDYFLCNFIQSGESGRDEYKFFLRSAEYFDKNFEATIKTEHGPFADQGELRFYLHVEGDDYEKLCGGVQELVEKYELVRWYNYDKTAVDYHNAEWFQIDIGFEDEEGNEDVLAAMGTEHPENYDAFREEFIALMEDYIVNHPQEEE